MSDFLDSDFSSTLSSIGNSIQIFKQPPMEQYNAAMRNFSTAGEGGLTNYNLPKMKYSFIVEFVLSEFAKNFIRTQLVDTHNSFDIKNVTCFVRDVKLPSQSFAMDELNQYNKTRILAGKITYKPVSMTFFDTVDSSAFLLIDAYRKYYYGDMFNKNSNSFRNDLLSSPNQFDALSSNWGRSVMNNGDYDSQYFFKAINIYEIDNDKYTCHNMYNVYVEDFEPDTKSHDSTGEPSTISLTLRYEGVGNNGPSGFPSIAAPTLEIAPLIVNASMYGKAGFFKFFGEMDDKSVGLATIGKLIHAGTAGYDIVKSVGDILNGDFNVDTIRNLGSAISKGSSSIGLGDLVSEANNKFGLGNILGDF